MQVEFYYKGSLDDLPLQESPSLFLKNVLSLTKFPSMNNLEITLLATTWKKRFGVVKKAIHYQTEDPGSSPSFANFLVHDKQITYIFFSVIRELFLTILQEKYKKQTSK